jgi:EAL domain-containing protein (putative c-di-GMP-specific phosphodiesterase class I)
MEVLISASMGIASGSPAAGPAVSGTALIRDADIALDRAKREGRGTWVVLDEPMRDAVRERLELEVELRAALAGDQLDQLCVVYQPIIDLPTGLVSGAEALVRWRHPQRGMIGPEVFIPIAEESGLISQLGNWVLERAIAQLSAWREADGVADDFWISVNVSAWQLSDPRLPGYVAERLLRWRVPAGCLALEITESAIVGGSAATAQVLQDLRAVGVGLSVDDFGTGFSALGYLRAYPVTGVKIDRSFVSGLGTHPEDEAIVQAIVTLGTALGLSVIATGVETTEQRAALSALGVPLGQGWVWGLAIDPGEFAQKWAAPTGIRHRDTARSADLRRHPQTQSRTGWAKVIPIESRRPAEPRRGSTATG